MDYIPVAEDITPEALTSLVTGDDFGEVAQQLKVSKAKLEYLLTSDEMARDMILDARHEFEECAMLRLLLMSDEALDTIENAMRGNLDNKKARVRVQAAETILDRGLLPKQRRSITSSPRVDTKHVLPDLSELIEAAETNEQALEIVESHQRLVREFDKMRRGAKDIIDLQANEVGSPT